MSCGKQPHKSRNNAMIAKRRLKNCLLNAYYCNQCKAWHLGRSTDKTRNAERITEVLNQYNKALSKRLQERPQ